MIKYVLRTKDLANNRSRPLVLFVDAELAEKSLPLYIEVADHRYWVSDSHVRQMEQKSYRLRTGAALSLTL